MKTTMSGTWDTVNPSFTSYYIQKNIKMDTIKLYYNSIRNISHLILGSRKDMAKA